MNNSFQQINKPIRKKDAMNLLLGKPAYVEDITPDDCLIVKVLRSPHGHALIKEIDISAALSLPGIEVIYTYKDVPQERFTMAGQTYPEPSPYDRLILDQRVRFVGDAVAIVAGETEKIVDAAMKLIKVKYEVLKPVLDLNEAIILGKMIQGKGFDEVVTMMKSDFKIVFLDSETLGSDIDVSKLNRYGDVTIYHQSQVSEVPERIKDASVVITNKHILKEEQLKDAHKLKLICVTATGVNNIDL